MNSGINDFERYRTTGTCYRRQLLGILSDVFVDAKSRENMLSIEMNLNATLVREIHTRFRCLRPAIVSLYIIYGFSRVVAICVGRASWRRHPSRFARLAPVARMHCAPVVQSTDMIATESQR